MSKITHLCSWVDCQKEFTTPQVDSEGKCWAKLCADHAKVMQDAIEDINNPKRLLSCWIKAQGGAKAAASRM